MATFQEIGNIQNAGDAGAGVRLTRALTRIYGDAAPATIVRVKERIHQYRQQRHADLVALDGERLADPGWNTRSGETIYTCYVDRFADDLEGVSARLDYLEQLGVRWVHLLPLLKARPGDSDGGFAVADYRQVEPSLGDMSGLARLADAMRRRGMGLMLDIVCNHTAREHDWAVRAREGDPRYRGYYHIVASKADVDAWEASLIDVFPDTAPGSFTHDPDIGGWVWTSFYPFQWDLNYANPDVFCEMLEVLLFLANQGVQAFRLDSAPFLWKRLGTSCRNLPEAYAIVAAFRAALDIAAPSVALLTEAIESPAHVIPFFGHDGDGCELAYNNGVMTALWAALADGDARIMATMLTAAADRPDRAAWLNYVRCHDDLIWNALEHYAPATDLQRWSSFYDGNGFSGGRRFQTAPGGVPSTNGMAAALVGLGRPDVDQALALARLRLVYGIIHALDGWPMIYMGDEIALGNDLDYLADTTRRAEGRWLQRPQMDWARAQAAMSGTASVAGEMLMAMRHFGTAARDLNALNVAGRALPLAVENDAVLAFSRMDGRPFACLANLTAQPQAVTRHDLWDMPGHDVLTQRLLPGGSLQLDPYQLLWWVLN